MVMNVVGDDVENDGEDAVEPPISEREDEEEDDEEDDEGVKTIQLGFEHTAELWRAATECALNLGIDSSIYTSFASHNYKDTDEVKNFLFCISKRTGLCSEVGIVDIEKALSVYPDTVDIAGVKETLENCQPVSEKEKDPRDRIFKFFKCFEDNTPIRNDFFDFAFDFDPEPEFE